MDGTIKAYKTLKHNILIAIFKSRYNFCSGFFTAILIIFRFNNSNNELIDMSEIEALLAEQKDIQEEGKKLLEQAPKTQQLQYENIK